MRLLLDTHTFLWFVLDDPQLSKLVADLIEDAGNEIFLSIVSLGKLTLAQPIELFLPDQLQRSGIQTLPASLPHTLKVATLPFHHRDPFDRLLIAQSLVEGMPVISIDAVLDLYGITRLWQ